MDKAIEKEIRKERQTGRHRQSNSEKDGERGRE